MRKYKRLVWCCLLVAAIMAAIMVSYNFKFSPALPAGILTQTTAVPATVAVTANTTTITTTTATTGTTGSIFIDRDPVGEAVDSSVADLLRKEVRILIWVMTSPKTLEKARAVKSTWGTRCDLLLFFSSENNTEIPTIKLNVSEGREHLLDKTTQAFDYIYDNYFNQADWFMKVDDDTFVVMENLRFFLYDKNPSEPLFTGRHFHEPRLHVNYQSGGAGYVLSREALRRFGTRQRNPPVCTNDTIYEDVEMGRCLERLGVRILNSTDQRLRSRFHPYDPESHVAKGLPVDYSQYDANSAKVGLDAVNDHAITFHYISPQQMRLLYYYAYHFRPFGISFQYNRSSKAQT